jgi:hypothetical protein
VARCIRAVALSVGKLITKPDEPGIILVPPGGAPSQHQDGEQPVDSNGKPGTKPDEEPGGVPADEHAKPPVTKPDEQPGGVPADEHAKPPVVDPLEGKKDYQVFDPKDPGRTITDIDSVEGNVLVEEKSATQAVNRKTGADETTRWVQDQVTEKFAKILEARQYLPGHEDDAIAFRFTKPGADPAFQAAVEAEIVRLRAANPTVEIKIEWK